MFPPVRGGTPAKFVRDPHHDGSPGHVDTGDGTARLRVRVPGGADAVYARVVEDGEAVMVPAEPVRTGADAVWFEAAVPLRPVVTNYRFAVVRGTRYTWLNQEGAHDHEVTDAADFRLVNGPQPPEWVPGTSVYQVFPDRFARDDDSVGPRPSTPTGRCRAPGTTSPPPSARRPPASTSAAPWTGCAAAWTTWPPSGWE